MRWSTRLAAQRPESAFSVDTQALHQDADRRADAAAGLLRVAQRTLTLGEPSLFGSARNPHHNRRHDERQVQRLEEAADGAAVERTLDQRAVARRCDENEGDAGS